MSTFLQNATLALRNSGALLEAAFSLSPLVVRDYFGLAHAATAADARAGTLDPSDRKCEKLLQMTALKLCALVLTKSALTDQELERVLDNPDGKVESELRELLLNGGFFREETRFGIRALEYVDQVLHHHDRHPAFPMDLNMLLNAMERLSGFVPFVPTGESAPSAMPPCGSPEDRDFMFLVRAVAGEPTVWLDRTNRFSEFRMLRPLNREPVSSEKSAADGRERNELLRYLRLVWSGATAIEVAALDKWQKETWDDRGHNPACKKPKTQPKHIAEDGERQEVWFYINGVVTDPWIAQLNAEHLAHVFKRTIHVLHNPTYGLDRDLRECVRGRLGEKTDHAARIQSELVKHSEKKGKVKIVIIAHSQGTIIASGILRGLPEEVQQRLEVFNFAFCADQFPAEACRTVEHFVNEQDFVPSLSMVPENFYRVPGRIFRQPGKLGHFLGAHYLEDFRAGKYRDQHNRIDSVLYRYRSGANYGKILKSGAK